jgi:hypothetical protein
MNLPITRCILLFMLLHLFFSATPPPRPSATRIVYPSSASPANPNPGPVADTLITTLQDLFKAYTINHIIDDQKEMITLYAGDGSEKKDLDQVVDQYIHTCQNLKNPSIADPALLSQVNNYLNNTITNYRMLKAGGWKSTKFKTSVSLYQQQKKKYNQYLTTTFALSRWVSLTEDKYWATMDKKNYIKSPRFATYSQLKKTNLPSALRLLDSLAHATNNFQEATIYRLELADQYVKHPDVKENATQQAIDIYRSILDQRQYCLYLFEAWVKWRAVSQESNGLSTSSDIPNKDYDKVREATGTVLLNYISTHRRDEMAINQFLVVTTHDIIFRFGQYPFGNQNTLEYHELFDE